METLPPSLDASWHIRDGEQPVESALFVAMSYHSQDRVGCHLVLGTAALDPAGSSLLTSPTRHGHWLVDSAINPSWGNRFSRTERADGMIDHLPTQNLQAPLSEGIKKLTSAEIPVSWISSEERLSSVVDAHLRFFMTADAHEIGRLCQEAKQETG